MPSAMNVTRLASAGAAVAAGLAGSSQAQDVNGFYGGLSASTVSTGTLDNWWPDDYSFGGSSAGLFAGYNFAQGDWVLGVELAYTDRFNVDGDGYDEAEADGLRSMIDLRGRVGRVFGNTLVYGSLGFSSAKLDLGISDDTGVSGMNFGIGAETKIGEKGFVGLDITSRNFSKGQYSVYVDSENVTSASIRAGFRF